MQLRQQMQKQNKSTYLFSPTCDHYFPCPCLKICWFWFVVIFLHRLCSKGHSQNKQLQQQKSKSNKSKKKNKSTQLFSPTGDHYFPCPCLKTCWFWFVVIFPHRLCSKGHSQNKQLQQKKSKKCNRGNKSKCKNKNKSHNYSHPPVITTLHVLV